MDARRWLWGALVVVASCAAQTPSGEIQDANKSKEPVRADYLPSEPAKQDEGIKGMKGFGRAEPPPSVKKADNPEDRKPLAFHPVAYFAKNCAGCHGKDGAGFSDKDREAVRAKDFGAKVAGEVRDKTKNKIVGRDLAAVVELTRAVLSDAAYVAWVDGSAFEVRPESTVITRGAGEAKNKSATEWTITGLKDGSEVLATWTKKGGQPSTASLIMPKSQAVARS